ncbi:MAG: hypothetical protein B9J98_08160 [Candidatus Terraquivivens tikiterensis]|uniref:Uncharacterized protein n=1 Tax=Candidatus Terraquivivens tikiterensis TaxID=1980982 RepID=A0A2R7Y2H9_9ARCH|nr:MAG: hypothetical protein B9J98_08160 [Candidatus Terraquivivens tikiterensis]
MICPFISACKAKVTYEHYTTVCSNISKDAYKECPDYKKFTSESRTPVEWTKILSPMPSPP